jgi:hypothetical protein
MTEDLVKTTKSLLLPAVSCHFGYGNDISRENFFSLDINEKKDIELLRWSKKTGTLKAFILSKEEIIQGQKGLAAERLRKARADWFGL